MKDESVHVIVLTNLGSLGSQQIPTTASELRT